MKWCTVASILAVLVELSFGRASITGAGKIPGSRPDEDKAEQWWQQMEREAFPVPVQTENEEGRILGPVIPEKETSKQQQPTTVSVNSIVEALNQRPLRGPVAVLVDSSEESLGQARRLWSAVFNPQSNEKATWTGILFMPFDDSDMSRVIQPRNMSDFEQSLNSVGPSKGWSSQRGGPFYAILKATEQVPYDSAVLLFSSRPARDEDLAALARSSLIRKRCKLYVWWSGNPASGSTGSDVIFREVAEFTEGKFHADWAPLDTTSSTEHMEFSESDTGKVILAVRRQVQGHLSIPVYVDHTISDLYITIKGNISRARLQQQQAGMDIDLLSGEEAGVVITRGPALLRAQLNTRGVGLWKLSIDTDDARALQPSRYDVIVKGSSQLAITTVAFDSDREATATTQSGPTLEVDLEGSFTNITGVSVLNVSGSEVTKAVYQQGDSRRRDDGSLFTQLAIPITELPAEPFFLQLKGYDHNGAEFKRAKFVPLSPSSPQSRSLVVDLNQRSVLTVLPGQMTRLYFDVSNNSSQPMTVALNCKSRHASFIQLLHHANVRPFETITVEVQLHVPGQIPVGTVDTVTFQASELGFNKVDIPLLLLIGNAVNDKEKPIVSNTFNTDCKNLEEENCFSRRWNVELKVESKRSGILRVSSQPQGLVYEHPFIIGSKSPVSVSYSESCCNPKVDFIVTDVQNNTLRYSVDARYPDSKSAGLSAGEIAAIVLGILILLAIIILIVVLIVRKRRMSLTFQQHQTPR